MLWSIPIDIRSLQIGPHGRGNGLFLKKQRQEVLDKNISNTVWAFFSAAINLLNPQLFITQGYRTDNHLNLSSPKSQNGVAFLRTKRNKEALHNFSVILNVLFTETLLFFFVDCNLTKVNLSTCFLFFFFLFFFKQNPFLSTVYLLLHNECANSLWL